MRVITTFFLAVAMAIPSAALGDVPGQIHYHGTLRDTQGALIHCPTALNCPSGAVSVTFRLYEQEQGGASVWEENWPDISVSQGRVNLTLGATSAIDASALGGSEAWLGLEINDAGELTPRQQVVASPYALVASTAIEADNAATLGGQPPESYVTVDNIGGLCVTEDDLMSYGYMDEGAVSGYLVEKGYVPGPTLGSLGCLEGQVPVWGGEIWGCGNAALSPDALALVSNGLLTNQFVDLFPSPNVPIAILDDNPVGVSDEIEVPDVGIAQSLKIHVEIVNSKLSAVLVKLYDADDVEHILFAGGDVVGDTLIATYPNPDPQIAGDLTTWHGKNPKGTWRLVVIDDDFLNNQIDGEIVSWSVEMGTLSNQKVAVTGDLIVEGKVQGDLDTDGQVKAGGVQFKPSDAPPAPCSPVSEGTVYYDASVKSLRVCNGSEYLRLVMCSEACPDAADVSCGAPIENDCKELCGGEGVGLNTTQCLVNAATTPCAALVADNCANDCNLSGTSLDLDACADPANVTCGDVITDACGNACGTTGDKCDEVDTSCSGGSCVYQYHASCKEIQLAGGDQGSGNYVIDPDGPGGQAPMEVYCDMDGGWTLCASLTRGYVPSDMLYSKNTYAFRARKDGTNDFAYERDAPSRFSNTWEQSEALNYGQFCRLIGEAPNETRVEAKLYNQCNCSASGFKGKNYDQVRNGVYDGNLFLDWFSNDASGAFQKKSGDALTICSSNNGYGGPYATKSVGWSGGAGGECDNNVPYTQSTNPWGEAGGGCVGCTDSGGFYDKLAYGQVGILNDLSNPFWNGIPNVKYGWSDCSADGNCNYQESGYGVWLFWVR